MSEPRMTALSALDDAIELVRTEPLQRLLTAAAPGLAMTWLAMFAYYVERVEGVRSLRTAIALGFVLLWGLRALLTGRFAGHVMERLLRELDHSATHGPLSSLLGAAALLGCELWLWLWLLVAAIQLDPWLTLAVLPVFALRGALFPSWLATCDALPACGPWAATSAALRSAGGQRATGVLCELVMLFGALALFFNVGGLLAAFVSLSQDLLGVSLSFVRAFISPSNHFALIALAGCSFSAFEPLRAALSAVLLLEGRDRREALRVQAAVRRCIAQGTGTVLLPLLLLASPQARAQDVGEPRPGADSLLAPDADCDEACRKARAGDDALLIELVSLLDGDAFREFPDQSWTAERVDQESFARWLSSFLRWLHREPTSELPRTVSVGRAGSQGVGAGLAISLSLLACLILVLLTSLLRGLRQRRTVAVGASDETPAYNLPVVDDDLERDLGLLLRALYLSSLGALARRGLLALLPARSNGDYVRALPLGREREALAELTLYFDRYRYGAEPPTAAQLARARQLARELSDEVRA